MRLVYEALTENLSGGNMSQPPKELHSTTISKEKKSLVIDADEAKPYLGDIRHSGATHKESGDIVDNMVTPEAMIQNKNIILPLVGKNINRVRGLRDAFVDAGYLVNLYFIDLPPEKATQRVVERFQKTGRFVDPNYVLNLGLTPGKNYDILKQEKGWAGYEKYSTDVERGQPPVLIEQGGELSTDAGRSLRLSGGGNAQGGEGRASEDQRATTTKTGISHEVTTPQQPQLETASNSELISAKNAPDIRGVDRKPIGWKYVTTPEGATLYNHSLAQKVQFRAGEGISVDDARKNAQLYARELQQSAIELPPFLKTLTDTNKLSLSDALEINDIATQNNWSEDTVKQFYKNAVEKLGIQNKDTASLEQMLITAKLKEAIYKQNAEKYKQEISETEAQIERLSRHLKIEGGAPSKIEDIDNLVKQKLKEYGELKPEELIQKALDEQGLNLVKIDAGVDVKTLMVSAIEAVREITGTEKTEVSHEQLLQDASKELRTIYNEVMGLEHGTILPSAAKQVAARMMRNQLFLEASSVIDASALNPKNKSLKEIAPILMVRAAMFGSKMGASSTEAARMTESGKIQIGAAPATEEFLRALEILKSGEISPEQLKLLKDSLQSQEQIDEATREMAKPVTRRIQDIFLEAWINGLLSNPQTHTTNFLSNLYTAFASIPERYLAAKTHYGNTPGVVDGEAKAMLFGMQRGFRDAVNAARIVWATETGRFGKDARKVLWLAGRHLCGTMLILALLPCLPLWLAGRHLCGTIDRLTQMCMSRLFLAAHPRIIQNGFVT
ncbi:MAG: Zeta toxin, partial [Candidatus Brocadia sinica]